MASGQPKPWSPRDEPPTSYEDWVRSDKYHNEYLVGSDPALKFALENSASQGLWPISVSAAQGKFLYLVAKTARAKRILEVGTLGGYAAIWMARALPDDGELTTLEIDEKTVGVARANIENAGLTSKIKVIHGAAIDSLPTLGPDGSYDLAFLDADKESNLDYFKEAKRLVRSGGIIIVDNVVRNGDTANPTNSSSAVLGVRRLLDYLKDDPTVEVTTIATVGEKGYDGFMYAYKL